MVLLSSYKQVDYKKFRDGLEKRLKASKKKYFDIAVEIGATSTESVRISIDKNGQRCSDTMLTNIMKAVGFDAIIGYHEGERKYFIKK